MIPPTTPPTIGPHLETELDDAGAPEDAAEDTDSAGVGDGDGVWVVEEAVIEGENDLEKVVENAPCEMVAYDEAAEEAIPISQSA